MNSLPIERHIEFFEHQIISLENEWKAYASSPITTLIQEKRLFIGQIWGIQELQKNVILRFKERGTPRMKQPYFLGITTAATPRDPMTWMFSYRDFRESLEPRYYSGYKAEITTINFWKTEDGWSYILVSGFELALLQQLWEKFLSNKIHPRVVVAELDPPIDYLMKLKDFVVLNPNNAILSLDLKKQEKHWTPHNIDNQAFGAAYFIDLLLKQPITLIQGPPGTGKTYLAAEICDYYLKTNKSVCVTALTNKALMELASESGLEDHLKREAVYKTNLSSDEQRVLPQLRAIEAWAPNPGELLLATYYKLSQKQAELLAESKRFDLLIIEEASQAYLATIAMFSSLATTVLVIGDYKQLTPIVINPNEVKQIHPLIQGVVNGLQTFSFNQSQASYRLTKTRRLPLASASLTGLYYANQLSSISSFVDQTNLTSQFKGLFHPAGGVSIVKLPTSRTGFSEEDVVRFICVIARDILSNNTELNIALLTPYIGIESFLYEQYGKLSKDFSRITIHTVHKIQGMTTDYTIVYLPLSFPTFDLNDNLFNVSTSRAKRGTLIITYEFISLVTNISTETKNFINTCLDVTSVFKKVFHK